MVIGCMQLTDVTRYEVRYDSELWTSQKIWRLATCAERTAHGKDFELILTVKMKTRYSVEGPFRSEFPAICNHCGVMKA